MRVNFFTILVIFVLSLVGSPQKVEAAFMEGRVLLGLCQSPRETEQFICESYLSGLIDYHRLNQSLDNAPSVEFCLPSNIKLSDIREVVVEYLVNNRQHDDFEAASAVTLALFDRYPCPKRPVIHKGW